MRSADARAGRSRWGLGVGFAVVGLLVLAGALLAWNPAPVLRTVLRLAGEEIRFDDLRVGLNELELSGVAFGGPPAHELRRLRLSYEPRTLLDGRIKEVAAHGLTLRGSLDADGLHLPGLQDASGGAGTLPPLPERIAIQDARLELATPFGALSVPFAGELRPEQGGATFTLEVEQAQLTGAIGRALADLRLEGEMPLEAERLAAGFQEIAAEITASGRADLRAEGLSLPGLAEGIDGQADLAAVWEHGRLDASLASLRLELAAIAPAWSALVDLLPAPWLIEVEQPAAIAASLLADETLIEGHGGLALATARGHLSAAASATLALAPDGALRELVLVDGEVGLRGLGLGGMHLDRGAIRLNGAGTEESWEGELSLELAGAGAPTAGLRLEGVSAQADLDARFADHRLTVLLRESGTVRLAQLSLAEEGQISELELRLQTSDTPLLSVDFREGDVAWRERLTAEVSGFEATALAAGAPLRLEGEVHHLDVEFMGKGPLLETGRVAASGGVMHAPAHDIRLSGIDLEIPLAAGGLAPEQAIPVTVGSIGHEGAPAWFAPLRLEGSARPQGDRIGFDASIARTTGGIEARVVGEHDLASGQGQAQLKLPPVNFAPGQLQPAGLSPLLGGVMTDVAGRLALDGALRWGAGGGIGADIDLLVENLAFSSGPARFAEVNGVIELDRLVPPSTPPGQQLAVGLIDIGLPLTNGLLTFDLEPQHLAVEQLSWQFAQGRIRAAPFTIGSADMRFATTLTAERLELDEIFALTQLDGLSGKGTMHGTLPITVAGAEATIEGGELVSDRPGWVRYRPDQAPAAFEAAGENVELLLQALENFRYETLRLTIDGRTDAEMDVGLHIAGANPDLYDGYPIEFNLNLEGALANILRSGLAGYQIPERIRERMQGFGR